MHIRILIEFTLYMPAKICKVIPLFSRRHAKDVREFFIAGVKWKKAKQKEKTNNFVLFKHKFSFHFKDPLSLTMMHRGRFVVSGTQKVAI